LLVTLLNSRMFGMCLSTRASRLLHKCRENDTICVLTHCWDFSAPPQWFCPPLLTRRQGNCASLVTPPVHLLYNRNKLTSRH